MTYEMGLHHDLDRARDRRKAAADAVKVAKGRRDGSTRKKYGAFVTATADQLRIENELKEGA